jgi:hypothetical protein
LWTVSITIAQPPEIFLDGTLRDPQRARPPLALAEGNGLQLAKPFPPDPEVNWLKAHYENGTVFISFI